MLDKVDLFFNWLVENCISENNARWIAVLDKGYHKLTMKYFRLETRDTFQKIWKEIWNRISMGIMGKGGPN